MSTVLDNKFMLLAIAEARKAYTKGEVPVGAVIVRNGVVFTKAYNLCESKRDAVCHAEILAIKSACKKLGNWRLLGCEIYVTLEPCCMCMGAILQSRMERVVFGAFDFKRGVCGSAINLINDRFAGNIKCIGGVLAQECGALLSSFFDDVRKTKN